jgi:hypothetical protein
MSYPICPHEWPDPKPDAEPHYCILVLGHKDGEHLCECLLQALSYNPTLQAAESPIIPGLELFEVTYAEGQEQYRGLRALKSMRDNGAILTRWVLDSSQRDALVSGAELYLEILTFHQPLQPVRLMIGAPNIGSIRNIYGLEPSDTSDDTPNDTLNHESHD